MSERKLIRALRKPPISTGSPPPPQRPQRAIPRSEPVQLGKEPRRPREAGETQQLRRESRRVPVIADGPGSELKAMLAQLGFEAGPACRCNQRAAQMDEWGVEGCKAHREEIVAWLRSEQAKRGWLEKARAAVAAVASGVAFHINPLDPAGSLFDEAIRRAEIKEAVKAQAKVHAQAEESRKAEAAKLQQPAAPT